MKVDLGLNKKFGILGGGQLGRMLIQKAIDFNIGCAVLDPDPSAPCYAVTDQFTVGDISDFKTVYDWGKLLNLITIEIEHVNTEALQKLVDEGIEVFPQPAIIAMIQDKGLQKLFYKENKVPSAGFILIEDKESLKKTAKTFPYVLKSRKAGYDGKGVMLIRKAEDLDKAFEGPYLVEDCIAFEKEISVIVARNKSGEVMAYPPVEMNFNSDANLVEYLFSPADITENIAEKSINLALEIINKLAMVGLLAVEMFLTKSGEILVNEIAPRTHNSGHQTIEGNITSQYEQLIRAILNLPLGSGQIIKPSVMVNLLGEKNYNGPAKYIGLNEVLALKGTYVHLYGKKTTRPFRKMGHVTVTANDINEAMILAQKVKNTLKVIS